MVLSLLIGNISNIHEIAFILVKHPNKSASKHSIRVENFNVVDYLVSLVVATLVLKVLNELLVIFKTYEIT